MSSDAARFSGELDDGWAANLRPLEYAAASLLSQVADTLTAPDDDDLRFTYTARPERQYSARLRVSEHDRLAALTMWVPLPQHFPEEALPALLDHLNACSTGGEFSASGGTLVFQRHGRIGREAELPALRRLLGASALALELCELAVSRVSAHARSAAEPSRPVGRHGDSLTRRARAPDRSR